MGDPNLVKKSFATLIKITFLQGMQFNHVAFHARVSYATIFRTYGDFSSSLAQADELNNWSIVVD